MSDDEGFFYESDTSTKDDVDWFEDDPKQPEPYSLHNRISPISRLPTSEQKKRSIISRNRRTKKSR